jgi:hypothetical protein
VPAHSIGGVAVTYNRGTHRGMPLRMNLTVNTKSPTNRIIHTLPLLIQGGGRGVVENRWGVVENRGNNQKPTPPPDPLLVRGGGTRRRVECRMWG